MFFVLQSSGAQRLFDHPVRIFRTCDYGFIAQNTIAVNTGLPAVVSVPEATGLAAFPVGTDKTVVCGRVC
jgi:hypothetical protein